MGEGHTDRRAGEICPHVVITSNGPTFLFIKTEKERDVTPQP